MKKKVRTSLRAFCIFGKMKLINKIPLLLCCKWIKQLALQG